MEKKTDMAEQEATVFIVDDDLGVREALGELVRSVCLKVETFAAASEFLESYDPARSGCVVLDMRLPGMSGGRLQDELIARRIDLPIIFLTGYGDAAMAVEAMRKGAYDFLEKPVGNQVLLDRIHAAVAEDQRRRRSRVEQRAVREKLDLLTPREREVLDLLREGRTARAVARTLDISQKTAQVDRTRIIQKMQVGSVLELMTLLQELNPG